MNRSPPPLATWLLKHLGCGRWSESLLGDLFEQYAQGRSKAWYWKQVFVALSCQYVKVFREHGLSFVGAVAIGWGVIFIWQQLSLQYTRPVDTTLLQFIAKHQPHWTPDQCMSLVWPLEAMVRAFAFAAAGWLVARIHPPNRRAALVAAISAVILCKWPWLQLHVHSDIAHKAAYYLTGVAAFLLGGMVFYRWPRRRAAPAVT